MKVCNPENLVRYGFVSSFDIQAVQGWIQDMSKAVRSITITICKMELFWGHSIVIIFWRQAGNKNQTVMRLRLPIIPINIEPSCVGTTEWLRLMSVYLVHLLTAAHQSFQDDYGMLMVLLQRWCRDANAKPSWLSGAHWDHCKLSRCQNSLTAHYTNLPGIIYN